MSDILCVTSLALCKEDFLNRIRKIATAHPAGIILREKDMSEAEYKILAESVIKICQEYSTPCILHSYVKVAKEAGCSAIHLPLSALQALSEEEKAIFTSIGASCHSVEEALEAEKSGCTYITAGHIFDTDCKKDLPGRGLEVLNQVCQSVSIPVYAIGGIQKENIMSVRNAGAAGACVMSGVMICENPEEYLTALKEKENEVQ